MREATVTKRRSNIRIALFAAGFLICAVVFFYPTISNLWNAHINSKVVHDYSGRMEEYSNEELEKMWRDAELYNDHLGDEEALKRLGLSYDELLNPDGDSMMGFIEIPKIRVELPIYHSLDEHRLQKGVGHLEDTPLPVGGIGNRCVLAGHTGLATARLLSNIDQLKKGDIFRLNILNRVLIYQVVDTVVVLPNEVKYIRPIENQDLVTLITCTPYGINSHRLLVTGRRITEDDLRKGNLLPSEMSFVDPRYVMPVELIIVMILFGCGRLGYVTYQRKHKPRQRESKTHEEK